MHFENMIWLHHYGSKNQSPDHDGDREGSAAAAIASFAIMVTNFAVHRGREWNQNKIKARTPEERFDQGGFWTMKERTVYRQALKDLDIDANIFRRFSFIFTSPELKRKRLYLYQLISALNSLDENAIVNAIKERGFYRPMREIVPAIYSFNGVQGDKEEKLLAARAVYNRGDIKDADFQSAITLIQRWKSKEVPSFFKEECLTKERVKEGLEIGDIEMYKKYALDGMKLECLPKIFNGDLTLSLAKFAADLERELGEQRAVNRIGKIHDEFYESRTEDEVVGSLVNNGVCTKEEGERLKNSMNVMGRSLGEILELVGKIGRI